MLIHYVPKNLKDALEFLATHDGYIMAGGTDLMVQKHKSSGLLPNLERDTMYIMGLKELDYIKVDSERNIHIGAITRYSELLKSALIPEPFKQVIREIASPNIRNMATLVGNIANASPAGDSLVPLNLYDASIVLTSKKGSRTVLVSDFIQGYRKTDHHIDELITEVIIPHLDLNISYRKVGSRKAETITKVSFMGGYKVDHGMINELRIAFGSVAEKIVRSPEIEQKYSKISVNELRARVDDIINEYDWIVTPITDQRSTKEYRKKVAFNLLRAFLKSIK